jgi:hypothetical protein
MSLGETERKMNTRSWMQMNEPAPRMWVKRTRGRRASDRRMNLETVLVTGVVLAWAWGIYEVTLLFLK